MRRILALALAAAACGGEAPARDNTPAATASPPADGSISIGRPAPGGDLVAPGLRGSPAWRLRTRRPGCVDLLPVVRRRTDAGRYCNAAVFVTPQGGVTVVSGFARRGTRVTLRGHVLPLSPGGAFLALVAHGHPHVLAGGRRLSERRHRPRGAVFNDEIGEDILLRTRAQVIARFGPPAASEGGCDHYRVVGDDRRRGWRFCYRAGGVMTGASGNRRLP